MRHCPLQTELSQWLGNLPSMPTPRAGTGAVALGRTADVC